MGGNSRSPSFSPLTPPPGPAEPRPDALLSAVALFKGSLRERTPESARSLKMPACRVSRAHWTPAFLLPQPHPKTLVDVLISSYHQFSSVTQSYPTLCDPMNRHTPGLPVHHQLPEFTQTHIHRVGDAIQPSHPLSSPSLAPNPSQHQRVFSNELDSCIFLN